MGAGLPSLNPFKGNPIAFGFAADRPREIVLS